MISTSYLTINNCKKIFQNYFRFEFFLILLIILITLLYFNNLTQWLINDDEGIYNYAAWRISLGDTPYIDFQNPHTPLSHYFAGWLFQIFGANIFISRFLTVLITISTGLVIYYLSRKNLNRSFSLLSIIIFLFSKIVFENGRYFMTDIYMVFFMYASVALLIKKPFRNFRNLFFAGLLIGLSVASKLFGVLAFLTTICYLSLDLRKKSIKNVFINISTYTFGFLMVIIPLFLIHYPNIIYDVWLFHSAKGGASLGRTLDIFVIFTYHHFIIVLFGLYFLFIKLKDNILLCGLIFSSSIFIFTATSFFERHLIYIIPALSIFCSNSFFIISKYHKKLFHLSFLIFLTLGSIQIYRSSYFGLDEDTLKIAKIVQQNTDVNDYILADYTTINFHAKRKAPPDLVDVASTATSSGVVNSKKLISSIIKNDVKMVLVHLEGGGPHFKKMADYELFEDFLHKKFKILQYFERKHEKWIIFKKY